MTWLERELLLWLWQRAMKRGGLRLPIGDVKVIAGPEVIEIVGKE